MVTYERLFTTKGATGRQVPEPRVTPFPKSSGDSVAIAFWDMGT